VRQLIVNADDLGLTLGVNRGILEAHTEGIVSSSTLMANGGAFDSAVAAVQSLPGLSVGCHVVLVDGTPVLDHTAVASLVTSESQPPEFHSRLSAFAGRAVIGRFDPDQLTSEIVAQVRKLQAAGIAVSHLDTHKHTHIFPAVLDAVVRAARICGVPAVRNPFVPLPAMRGLLGSNRQLWKRYSQVRLLRGFSGRFRAKIAQAGLVTPDGVIGVIETGSFESSLLRRVLQNLPDGTWELVCHPGYDDADLRKVHTRLLESRDLERRLLISKELREFLDHEKIRVMSYRELAKSQT
jgi:chitin disaccharide deacetylase